MVHRVSVISHGRSIVQIRLQLKIPSGPFGCNLDFSSIDCPHGFQLLTANSFRKSAVTIAVREDLNGETRSCCAIGAARLRPAVQRNKCHQSRAGCFQRGIREAGPKPAQAISPFPSADCGGASAVREGTGECSDHAKVANDVGGRRERRS